MSNKFEQPVFHYDSIGGITARCRNCNRFESTGDVFYETTSKSISEGGVVEDCRSHHIESKSTLGVPVGFGCSQFSLFQGQKEIGFVAVASEATSGVIEI
jgi:hypothetical protein